MNAVSRKVSPPYANFIDNTDDLVMIYCGSRAWELAKPDQDRVASLVFPSNRDPVEYRWPVLGKDVLILGQGLDRVTAAYLIVEQLRNGAGKVYVRYEDEIGLTCYDSAEPSAA